MNIPFVIFALVGTFFIGHTIGSLKDKKDTFNSGVETGKKIVELYSESKGIKTETNYLDLVRDYFPNISDEEADHILWVRTPFPMRMDEKEIARYLAEYKKGL